MFKNNKGFGLTEVIVASTVFIITYISFLNVININNQSFFYSKDESNISGMYGEIFGYLYQYKKNYGTNLFKQKIGMYNDLPCNIQISNESNGNNWCLAFPYYKSENGYNNLYFNTYNNTTNKQSLEISGSLNDIELKESSTQSLTDMYNFIKENKIKNYKNKQILVFYKQDEGSEDFFHFNIRILNKYQGNYYIIFNKSFNLY